MDDARLVVLNALDAAERGAAIRTRTKCVRAERGEIWRLILNDARQARSRDRARAGECRRALGRRGGRDRDPRRGSPARATGQGQPYRRAASCSITTPRYIFQNPDRRVVFAIPYERDFTLIGTTDENFRGDPAGVRAVAEEIAYLCDTASRYFRAVRRADDIVYAFAGVRSLYDDGSKRPEEVTRDYHLAFDKSFGHAPLLTVYGGKITTYRKLAEAALR